MLNETITLKEAQAEIEDLAIQLTDTLAAALHYAGVKKDLLQDAMDAYIESIDEALDDDAKEMGYEEIICIIEYLKKTQKHLFS